MRAVAPMRGVSPFSGRTQDFRPGLLSVALPGPVLGVGLVLRAADRSIRPTLSAFLLNAETATALIAEPSPSFVLPRAGDPGLP
jgi:hypothetical protein